MESEIRDAYVGGARCRDIAARFGVPLYVLYDTIRRRHWIRAEPRTLQQMTKVLNDAPVLSCPACRAALVEEITEIPDIEDEKMHRFYCVTDSCDFRQEDPLPNVHLTKHYLRHIRQPHQDPRTRLIVSLPAEFRPLVLDDE